jgi:TRAP-type C4-dicarboxylate transport system substrate-binding protein
MLRKLLIAVAGIAALATSPAGAETLRYSNFEPPAAITTAEMNLFFKDLAAETKGSLRGQVFPGAQLLGPAATLKGVGDGVVDGGFVVTSLSIGALPSMNIGIDTMFFVRDSMVAAAAVLETTLNDCPTCLKEAKAANVVWLGGFAPSPWHLMCRHEVKSLADLRGKKVRITGAAATRLIAALGAVAVQLPPTEIGPALQGGQVDCAVGPMPWLKEYGLMNSVKTVVDLPLGVANGLGFYVFTARKFERFSADQKKAFLKVVPISVVRGTKSYLTRADEVRAESEKHGIKFWKPDAAFDAAIKKFLDGDLAIVIADMKRRGISDAEALVKKHLANVAKWQRRLAAMKGDVGKLPDILREEVLSKVVK